MLLLFFKVSFNLGRKPSVLQNLNSVFDLEGIPINFPKCIEIFRTKFRWRKILHGMLSTGSKHAGKLYVEIIPIGCEFLVLRYVLNYDKLPEPYSSNFLGQILVYSLSRIRQTIFAESSSFYELSSGILFSQIIVSCLSIQISVYSLHWVSVHCHIKNLVNFLGNYPVEFIK